MIRQFCNMRETFNRNKPVSDSDGNDVKMAGIRLTMYLIALTILLMALTILSMVAPSLWQGFAILLVVILMAMESHQPPPV